MVSLLESTQLDLVRSVLQMVHTILLDRLNSIVQTNNSMPHQQFFANHSAIVPLLDQQHRRLPAFVVLSLCCCLSCRKQWLSMVTRRTWFQQP